MAELTLGEEYTDRVTDFRGTAVAIVEYLNGCRQADLVSKVDKKGEVQNRWVDEQQLIPVGADAAIIAIAPTGGPQDTPPSLDAQHGMSLQEGGF